MRRATVFGIWRKSNLDYIHCMSKFTYFAYGSNMLLERLRERCETAKFLGIAVAHGYKLDFSKKSKKDGSGKATIANTGNHDAEVYGALFEIDLGERPSLDQSEGSGYVRNDSFAVKRLDDNEELYVTTYIAKQNAIDESLLPYDWYKKLLLAGAWQGALPAPYVARLEAIDSVPDPCPDRPDRKSALVLLSESGWVKS